MALNGNPVAFARAAEASGTQAKQAFEAGGDQANAKLAEAVAYLAWSVAVMAERQGLDRDH